jgi:spore coat protein U-like protein
MKFSNSLKCNLSAAVLGVLALGLNCTSAAAATATSNFQVTATVQATCLISAGALGFGTYTGVLSNATSTISVTCTNTSGYNIGLSAGTTSGATVAARKMAGTGTDVLNYALFRDSSRTNNWGETVGTDTLAGSGNGLAQTITVYGQVPAGQYVSPGAYSDTITATITY